MRWLVHQRMGSIRTDERFTMNKFARFVPVALLAGAGSAFAEVPADVSTALGTMKTDALVIAGLVLVAIIAIKAFSFMKKGISG